MTVLLLAIAMGTQCGPVTLNEFGAFCAGKQLGQLPCSYSLNPDILRCQGEPVWMPDDRLFRSSFER